MLAERAVGRVVASLPPPRLEIERRGPRPRERPLLFVAPVAAVVEASLLGLGPVAGAHGEEAHFGREGGGLPDGVGRAFEMDAGQYQAADSFTSGIVTP